MSGCEGSNFHMPMSYFTMSCLIQVRVTSQVPQETSTPFLCTQHLIKSMSYSPDKSGICCLWQKKGLLESVMFHRHTFFNLLIFQHLYWNMVNWLCVKMLMFFKIKLFSFCICVFVCLFVLNSVYLLRFLYFYFGKDFWKPESAAKKIMMLIPKPFLIQSFTAHRYCCKFKTRWF